MAHVDPDACPESFIRGAARMADAAAEIVRRHFRSGVAVETKPDLSPVTEVDRAAEQAIRRIIEAEFQDHGVVGEEFGRQRDDAEYVWLIDPIDGTKAFICGLPVFGTLIALTRDGQPILGVIDQPISRERWIGATGRATTFNGDPVRARRCPDLGNAILCATTPHMFAGPDAEPFARVRDEVWLLRYGTECYAYGLLASGYVDLVIEANMSPYDYMAQVTIIEGAGGRLTDWEGRPVSLSLDATRVIAAGDPALYDKALDLLRN